MAVRTVRVELPDPFPPGARKLAFVDGRQVLIFNLAGALVAIDNSCPHAGGSLFSGKLDGQFLRCPSHGLKIDLLTGRMAGDADGGGLGYTVRPVAGGAELDLPIG